MEKTPRKRNIEHLSEDELAKLLIILNSKTKELTEQACIEINKLWNPYGLKVTKFDFEYSEIDKESDL